VSVREPAPVAVGQPLVTSGQWLDGRDGTVLEDGFAATLHVRPGDMVTIAGVPLTVRGSALTVARGRYPLYQPGWVWVTPATAEKLRAAGAKDFATTVELRLVRPDDAAGFVAAHAVDDPQSSVQVELAPWPQVRDGSHDELTTFAIALLAIGTLLGGLTVATAGVLVAGRMAAQIRQVGTLKAVGVTPGQVTGVLLVEYLSIAGLAALVGLPLGALLSPLLAYNAPSLYGPPQAPGITGRHVAIVLGAFVAIVLLASVRPAMRGVRQSTIRSLAASARPPRRASKSAAALKRLGVATPLVLGVRSALRRPARTFMNAAGLALAVALVVVALALDDGIDRFLASLTPAEAPSQATEQALIDQLLTLAYAAAALLIGLAAVNALIVAVFAARDSARNHAILQSVGATPRQTGTAFLIAQLGACLLGCAAGIPLGVALFTSLAGESLTPVRLSPLTYAAVAMVAILTYGLIVVVPARHLAAQPVAPRLAYE
jgi:putative ABC transport system permease protein